MTKRKDMRKIDLGKWGEEIARDFLLDRGCSWISSNYRTPDGEIDLVMKRADLYLFVEVKTRKDAESGLPEEAITDEKLDHLEGAVGWYLEEYPEVGENWRLDVVTVIGKPEGGRPQVDWFEDACGA